MSAEVNERIPKPVWILILATSVMALGYGFIAPVLPLYAKSFDVTVTATAVIVSMFAVFRLAFAPGAGGLVNKFGERNIYIVGLSIVALSSFAMAAAQSYWQLLIFRALGGIGSVCFTVSAGGLVVRLSPPKIRGRVSSAYAAAFLMGNLLGPVVGGLLANWGLRFPFIVYGFALLTASSVVFFFMPKEAVAKPGTGDGNTPMAVREAITFPTYRACLATGFSNGWANFGVRIVAVPLLVASISPEPWHAGLVLTAFAAGNGIALSFSGRLSDIHGRRPLVIAGLSIAAFATMWIGMMDELWLMVALSLMGGMGSGTMGPAQQAAIADVIGYQRSGGQVIAAHSMVTDTGQILGPVVTGLIIDQYGFGTGFGITGVILLLPILAWLVPPKIKRPAWVEGLR